MGTTAKTAAKARTASTSGVRHGPSDKNVRATAKPRPAPALGSRMSPLKGPDKGGID